MAGSLGTLTVNLELNGDGTFTTKIKKTGGAMAEMTAIANATTKSVNAISAGFSRTSQTVTTVSTKLGTLGTALKKAGDGVEALDARLSALHGSLASVSAGFSELTKSVSKFSTQTGKMLGSMGDLSKSVVSMAKSGQKAADGIRSIGTQANESGKKLDSFSDAAVRAAAAIKTLGTGRPLANFTSGAQGLSAELSIVSANARKLRDELNALSRMANPVKGSASFGRSARTTASREPTTSYGALAGGATSYGKALDLVSDRSERASHSHASFVHSLTSAAFVFDELTQAGRILYDWFGSWVERVVDANAHTEKMITTFRGLSTATSEAQRQQDALSDYNAVFNMASSSPFSVDDLSKGLIKLKTANLPDAARSLKSVSDAVAHFGGTDQQFESVTLAMQQMAGKGVVSMEELRRQMGEALPTAMQSMANAMNITMPQLVKLVTSGSLESKNALSLLTDEFDRLYGGSSEQKLKTFLGQMSLLNTNSTKFWLATGGRQITGDYDSNSSYTQMTNVIKTLNEALESPQAQQAARELNTLLVSLAKSAQGLIGFLQNDGLALAHLAIDIAEPLIAIKALNLALRGLLATTEALAGAKVVGAFAGSTGLGGFLGGLGRKTERVKVANATATSAAKFEERAVAGSSYAERGMGLLSSAADAGVMGIAAGAISKSVSGLGNYNKWLVESGKKLPALGSTIAAGSAARSAGLGVGSLTAGDAALGAMEGAVGGIGTMLAGIGPTAATIGTVLLGWAAPIAAAAAALGGVYYLMNKVGDTSVHATDKISSLAEGDVSDATMKAAKKQFADLQTLHGDVGAKLAEANSGSGFYATGFGDAGDVKGIKGLKSAAPVAPGTFGALTDAFVDKSSEEGKRYTAQLSAYNDALQIEIDRNKKIIDDAPEQKIKQAADEDLQKIITGINIDRRGSEAIYTDKMQKIQQKRLDLSGDTSAGAADAVSDLNNQAQAARLEEDKATMSLYTSALDKANKELESTKASSGEASEAYRKQLLVVRGLTEDTQKLAAAQAEANERAGITATIDGDKKAKHAQTVAGSTIETLQQKILELNDRKQEGFAPTDDYARSIEAGLEAGGKFTLALTTQQQALADLVEEYKRAKAGVDALVSAQNSYRALNTSSEKSRESISASLADLTSDDNGLGKSYNSDVAAIMAQRANALTNLDSGTGIIARFQMAMEDTSKSGLDLTGVLDQINTSSANVGTSLTQLSQTHSIVAQSATEQGNATSFVLDNLLTLANSSSGIAENVAKIGAAMDTIGAGNTAVRLRGIMASLQFAQSLQQKVDSFDESHGTPQQKADAQRTHFNSRFKVASGLLDPKNIRPEDISALAKQDNVTDDYERSILEQTFAKFQANGAKNLADIGKVESSGAARAAAPQMRRDAGWAGKLAAAQAELGGQGEVEPGEMPSWARYVASEKAQGRTPDARQKADYEQLRALQPTLNAQRGAIKNADFLIQKGSADEGEADEIFKAIGLGDPNKITTKIALIKGSYTKAIEDVRNSVKSEDQKADLIGKLTSTEQGQVNKELAERVQAYANANREILANTAETNQQKRQFEEETLDQEKKALQDSLTKSTANDKDKQASLAIFGEYYDNKMAQIERATEGALAQTAREWSDWDKQLQDSLNSAASGFIDTLATQLTTGKAEWSDYFKSILKMLVEMELRMAMSPLLKALGGGLDNVGVGASGSGSSGSGAFGFLGSLASSVGRIFGLGSTSSVTGSAAEDGIVAAGYSHDGGIMGRGEWTKVGSVLASTFANAPRFHTGGMPGLRHDEIPAILQRGEGVFTKGQMEAMGMTQRSNAAMQGIYDVVQKSSQEAPVAPKSSEDAGPSMPKVTMNFHNQTGNDVKAVSGTPKFDGEAWVIDTVIKHANRPGNLRNALGTR